MRKLIIIFLSLILLSCSKKATENNTINVTKLDESVEVAYHFAKEDIKKYTDFCLSQLVDSIDNSSGFLGWRNIRDYIHLGDETMKQKVNRIWKGIYEIDEVSRIANKHIEGLASGTNLDYKKYKVKIEYSNYIENYAHKIGLSFGFIIIEFIIESFVSFGIAFIIGFIISFLAAFLFSKDLSTSFWLITIICIITFIIFFIISYKADNISQEKYKEHLSEEITNTSMLVVKEKFDAINNDFVK